MNGRRICIVITTFFPLVGGAETQTLAQTQQLQARGYEPEIITFRHKSAWLPRETFGGVPVTRIAGRLLGNRDRFPRAFQRLAYVLAMLVMAWTLWRRRKDFDVLQVCQLSLLVLPLALVCRLARKPMIVVVISAGAGRATKSSEPARLVAGPLDANQAWLQVDGNTWIDGDLDGLARSGRLVLNYLCSQLNRISAVITVLSSRMKRRFDDYHLHLSDIQCIPNGVDLERFYPGPVGDERQDQTVICVSKLRYEKGIDVLLQAWHLVHKQVPQARLVIVGSGPIQSQLERMARELGIEESVEFAGLQSDVPAQLRCGSIGVLPSRWEGMPNALLEAMACGLACVATRVSGSEDVIQPGMNGLLVEPEDYQGMAEALLTLLNHPDAVRQYGQAARETIVKSYSLEHITDRYIEIYRRLADGGQQARRISTEPVAAFDFEQTGSRQ
jgi:glycosyltransferase involved in cell wall biosynthesis